MKERKATSASKVSPLKRVKLLISEYPVPTLFIIISILAIPASGFSAGYLIQELITRLVRNSFLVLSLIIPIMAGMGLNFGMTLGAMAGQIALIFVTDWNIIGLNGLFLAMILSIPMSLLFGYATGQILNKAKGREMVTSFILAFFANGIYQLIVLYGMGSVIRIGSNALVLSRGYGIRNAVNLINVRQVMDNLIPLKIFGINIPLATFMFITLLCLFILWFKKTKLGQDMRAIGQDMAVADAAGIAVEKTRITAIIISTVLAGIGQIIYLQNIGTMNTYNSHEQIGMFSIAAILIGGATVSKAKIGNVFLGVILFHLMFIVSPMAGKNLIGSAMLGEYFRVFISYGVISIALVLHAWKRLKEQERARAGAGLQGGDSPTEEAEA
ncbi:ABC transporter permease [Sediminispirochaeta smaragdinae]|uniref:Inner-membrane translocator n=1 Tax=Sediminispirochaeta smaragdinae (strain DSM 11293 / JCM 15392 / SEBR 4228) TaxID=573413 RepID=E1RBC0_SEDSS|nr:ABC transporter permease [Sediminispirochaeta smaragdinae]ADK79650.1 inner-membrane translocator [Sediminispirochaeta smaragdinae DSM 11293]